MIEFSKGLLREAKRWFGRSARPSIALAAFGKHPGWDDHMDDIGLETDSLLLAKQTIYLEGIASQINSGVWDKLDEKQRLPGFGHNFAWRRKDTLLFGKIWSSQDGKGRSKYPMIVCASCHGISLGIAFARILPVLDQFERACVQTRLADEVRKAYATAVEELGHLGFSPVGEAAILPERISSFVEEIAPRGDDEGFLRILYHLQTHLPSSKGWFGACPDQRAITLRLPASPRLERESFSYWLRFLEAKSGARSSLLLMMPHGDHWIDAIVGHPASGDFYSLRASSEAIAIVSQLGPLPDAVFRTRQTAAVQGMRAGRDFAACRRFSLHL